MKRKLCMVWTRKCTHPPCHRELKVISAAVNCETYVVICGKCGEVLEGPKTDC